MTACKEDTTGLIDLADAEIGYELPVYPDCEFDYKVNDECTVHISSIKATLIAKNEIHEGDVLTEEFYPCTIQISAIGSTDSKFAGKTIYLQLRSSQAFNLLYYYSATIESDGNIRWEHNQTNWTATSYIYFSDVTFNL